MSNPTFSPLTDNERNWIAQQLEGARRFITATIPSKPDSPITLETLDSSFAEWLSRNESDTSKINEVINSVGITFGQHLVDRAGFEWVIVTDQHGTDLAVRALPGVRDVVVFPANFVAKRWERRESRFLVASFQAIQKQVSLVHRPWWKFWA